MTLWMENWSPLGRLKRKTATEQEFQHRNQEAAVAGHFLPHTNSKYPIPQVQDLQGTYIYYCICSCSNPKLDKNSCWKLRPYGYGYPPTGIMHR